MERRGNCSAAPLCVSEPLWRSAQAALRQGGSQSRARARPQAGNPTEVRQKKDCYFNKVAILFNMQCCLNGRNMLTFSIDTFEMAYSFIRTMLEGLP